LLGMRHFLIALALACLFTGCRSSGTSNGGGSSTELRANLGLDFSNVAGFIIASGSRATPAEQGDDGGAQPNQLYALGKDDSLTVVTVTELSDGGSSSTSQTVEPLAVLDTTALLFLAFENVTHEGALCSLIAASKSDGALFCITDGPPPTVFLGGWAPPYGASIASDATGDLVWSDLPNQLVRYQLDDGGLTSSQPLGSAGDPEAQAVNSDGDDLIVSGDVGSQAAYTRVMLADGGIADVSALAAMCVVAGPASDAEAFYYLLNVGPTSDDAQWVRLAKTSSTVFTPNVLGVVGWADCGEGLVSTSTHFFLTGDVESRAAQVVDIVGGTATRLTVEAFVGGTISRIAGYEDALFILGTDSTGSSGLVEYEIATGTFTTLLAPGAYNITTMDVSSGGEVTFFGQRESDGAMVLGNLPAGATTPTIISTGLPGVTQIQRIN